MPQPNVNDVMQDPKFLGLPSEQQSIVLRKLDPKFAALPEAEQGKVLERLSTPRASTPPEGAPPEPSFGGQIAHELSVAGSGFNEGLSTTLGAPADLVNAGLKQLGLPMSDTPVMGSAFIQRYLMPEKTEPEGMGERLLHRTAEEVGATVPFLGGTLVARTAQIAEQGAGMIGNMIKDLQAIDPGKLALVESQLAASGGLGAGVMKEIFPQGGWMADFVGEMIGSLGTTAALGLIRKSVETIKDIPPKLGYKSEDAMKDQVGEKLNSLGRTSALEKGIEDTAQIQQDIPGFRPTTGQASGEPGMIQAERSFERSSAASAHEGSLRRKDNQTEIRSAVDEVAPEGSLKDVVTGIGKERERKGALLEKGLARAQALVDLQRGVVSGKTAQVIQRTEAQMAEADARAQSRLVPLQNKLTPQQQGAIIRQEYEKELDAYQAKADELYAKVDQSILLPPTNTRDAVKSVRADLRTQEADEFVPIGALADMEKLGVRTETTLPGPMAKPIVKTVEHDVEFGEFNAMKKRLQGEIRAAKNDTVKRRLKILLDGVERDIDQLTTTAEIKAAHPEAAQAYSDARDFSRQGIFRLKSGEADALRQIDRTGRARVGNDAVAQRFLDGEDSVDDFIEAMGSRPAARMALEDAAKLDFYEAAVNPSTGVVNPKIADKWLRDHQHLTKAFPELTQNVANASSWQKVADEVRANGKAVLKDPEARAKIEDPAMFDRLDRLEQHQANVAATVKRTTDQWEKSAASLFLNDDADRAATRIINSHTPQTKITQVLGAIGNDKDARRGFERAMWDAALSKFESKAVDALDRPILQARNMKEFMEENRSWMEPLFGAPRMKRLETAMNAAEMVERGGRTVLPGGSDTAVNLQAQLSDLGPFLSRLYSHQRGIVSLKWIFGERFARSIGHHLQKIGEANATSILNEAFYNPEVAHTLMLAAKGGNDRLIQKRFRFHLANMNQLNGDEADE